MADRQKMDGKHIMVRTSPEFHAQLVELAERENRSLNKQILTILEQYVQAHPVDPAPSHRRPAADPLHAVPA